MAATIAPTQRTGTPAHIAAAAAAAAANASNGTASGSGSTSTSTSGSGPRVTISANGPRRPSSAQPFHPPADTSTYRDLLLFEERLKMNAHMLRRRRRRYRIFLYSFIVAFLVMSYQLVVQPPENMVLLRGLQAVTVVVFITLALFFASGMYDEKIRYAHANKALRPLNMYFNVRRAPAAFLAFLPLPATLRPTPAPLKAVAPPGKRPASGRRVSNSGSHPGHTVMAQIPPSSNPRGELIFSSRVDQHFEEGYKRYRTAFERRRGQRDKLDAASAAPWYARLFRRGDSPTPEAAAHELSHRRGSSGSRASVSASSTNSALSPPASRRSTPEPSAFTSARAASPPRRRRTPPPPPNTAS